MVVETIAAAVAVLTGVGAFIRWVLPFLRKVGHFLDQWFGAPDRPGVIDRLKSVEAEFQPDHGSSMRDVVDRVEKALTAHLTDPQAHQRGNP